MRRPKSELSVSFVWSIFGTISLVEETMQARYNKEIERRRRKGWKKAPLSSLSEFLCGAGLAWKTHDRRQPKNKRNTLGE